MIFDDFERPDGLVIGSTANVGGVWGANPTPLPGLHIVSHEVQSPLNQESLASIASAMNSGQFAADWWCRLVGKVPTAGAINVAGCWLGDDQSGPYCGLAIQGSDVGVVNVTAANIGDGDFGFAGVNVPLDVPSEYVFQWRSAGGGRVSLVVNDVEIGSLSPYVLDPLTPLNFAFGIIQGVLPSVVLVDEVELGLGVYDA